MILQKRWRIVLIKAPINSDRSRELTLKQVVKSPTAKWMLALSSDFRFALSLYSVAWRCIKHRSNASTVTDADAGRRWCFNSDDDDSVIVRCETRDSSRAKVGARVSEFIRLNVCGRLIQGAAKRPGAFFMGAEKGAGEDGRNKCMLANGLN